MVQGGNAILLYFNFMQALHTIYLNIIFCLLFILFIVLFKKGNILFHHDISLYFALFDDVVVVVHRVYNNE